MTQRQEPSLEKIQKTAEIPQAQFIPLRHRTGTCDSGVQKTVELPQVQRTERILDVTVVIPHQVPTIWTVKQMVDVPQCQYLDPVVDVPVAMKRPTSLILQVTGTADIPPDAVR